DLFVIRHAGNVFDNHVGVASIEFAINQFHCPLLMVLGHDNCGAVTAALDAFEQNKILPGKLDSIVQAIRPAIEQSHDQSGNHLDNAINANVLYVMNQLKNADPFISQAYADGKLKIVGARYDLKSGAVKMLSN